MARRNITLLNMLLLLLLLLLLQTEKLVLSMQARHFHNVTFKLKHKAMVRDKNVQHTNLLLLLFLQTTNL